MRNRLKYMKDNDGNWKCEKDDDWPNFLVTFSPSERIIYTANGRGLVVQIRHRSLRNDNWGKWVEVGVADSPEKMRKLLEYSHPFASDSEKLDAICLKTEGGDYVEHSH